MLRSLRHAPPYTICELQNVLTSAFAVTSGAAWGILFRLRLWVRRADTHILVPDRNGVTDFNVAAKERVKSSAAVRHNPGYGKSLALAAFSLLLAAPALAGQPDAADLVAVHAELRAQDGIPAHDWPLGDGVWDCDDWGRWARAALEARGWPREALVIWAGPDQVFGDVHAVLCASGVTTEPVCLDRRWNAPVPLSSYGPAWRVYPWQ